LFCIAGVPEEFGEKIILKHFLHKFFLLNDFYT